MFIEFVLAAQALYVDWIHKCLMLSPVTNINFNGKKKKKLEKSTEDSLCMLARLQEARLEIHSWDREHKAHYLFAMPKIHKFFNFFSMIFLIFISIICKVSLYLFLLSLSVLLWIIYHQTHRSHKYTVSS